MKKIFLLVVAIVVGGTLSARAALEGGDLVAFGGILPTPNPTPAPDTPAIFNLKQNGMLETLISDGSKLAPSSYPYISYFGYVGISNSAGVTNIAVYPDGSGIAVAYRGNWNGGATPTPVPPGPGTPAPTPVPMSYWRQSAIYKVAKDGSISTIAEGGALNPLTSNYRGTGSLAAIAVDQGGTIYVQHSTYQYTTPPTIGQAILKVTQGSTEGKGAAAVALFLSPWSAGFPDAGGFGGNMTVAPDGNLIVAKGTHWFSPPAGTPTPATPTPMPAAIYEASPGGTVTQLASANVKTWPHPGFPLPYIWSEPFDYVWFAGFDIEGRPIFNGEWHDWSVDQWYSRFLAMDSVGVSELGDTSNGWWIDCIAGDGSYIGSTGDSVARVDASGNVLDYIIQNNPAYDFREFLYNPCEKPTMTPFADKETFATGESISLGFGLSRGVMDNEVDVYLGVQYPISEGGMIYLLNPNAATNHFPSLISLAMARRYPTQIAKLRYKNGTTSVKGNGTVTVATFKNVRGIPAGTYTVLGVITPTGSNLLDTSTWLTPNRKPARAETFFEDAI